MASTTKTRASSLPTSTVSVGTTPYVVVPNFAVFIDTHRDQPHVPTFEDDIHRGMSRPTMVHYAPPLPGSSPDDLGTLIRTEDGKTIPVDPKHRFVEVDWWSEFLTEFVMDHGVSPVANSGDTKGQLPTSHLRNARTKVYKLKSLRQIVRAWEKASVATTGTPFKARTKPHILVPVAPVAVALTPKRKPAAKKPKPTSAATALAGKTAAAKALAAALGMSPVPAPAAPKEPYKGPMVTDHPFTGVDDEKLCYWPVKHRDSFPTSCGIPKEGHA